ncbi:642_t:CDS:2, partial [Dentiscutata erythropus]
MAIVVLRQRPSSGKKGHVGSGSKRRRSLSLSSSEGVPNIIHM